MSTTTGLPSTCRHCGGKAMYTTQVSSGGGHAPVYLPQLGKWYQSARFNVVVCSNCGETSFFAPREVLSKLPEKSRWTRVG